MRKKSACHTETEKSQLKPTAFLLGMKQLHKKKNQVNKKYLEAVPEREKDKLKPLKEPQTLQKISYLEFIGLCGD